MAADETIQGLQALMATLGNLPSALDQKQILAKALRVGAEPIRARAAELAPLGETGKLREEMMISVQQQVASSAVAKIGPARLEFYGQFSEFGDSRQSAHPFLRPALDEKQEEALRIVGEELAAAILRELAAF